MTNRAVHVTGTASLMADREMRLPQFWINERDHHGRSLDPRVIEAARVSWERVLRCARARLKDPDQGPQIVERTALTVSRAIRGTDHPPIQDLAAYFIWACIREINRTAARESREEAGHATEHLERIGARNAGSWLDSLLDELQLEQLLYYLDEPIRKMFANALRRIFMGPNCGEAWLRERTQRRGSVRKGPGRCPPTAVAARSTHNPKPPESLINVYFC